MFECTLRSHLQNIETTCQVNFENFKISNFSFNLIKISLNRSHIQFAREYAKGSNIYIVSQFVDLGSECTKQ